MSLEREKSDLGFGNWKRMKRLIKTRCCLFKLDRLARAKTWSLERPDTGKPCSSEEKLARAKNSMLQVCNPEARSIEETLARAKKHCSQVYTRRKHSLERRNPGSNHQTPNSTLARATDISLERRTKYLCSNHLLPNTPNLE